MPVNHAVWKVGPKPVALPQTTLPSEALLETMIVADSRILSDEWMIIGQQEQTGLGGRIDLLAIAPDGALVLIELKRDQTPRDVVAQAIDYATFVEKLEPEDVTAIYGRFAPGRDLAQDFAARFGHSLSDDSLNQTHQIVIVGTGLDHSTERILRYLSDRGIPINVLFFQVFAYGPDELLSRAWLLDPILQQVGANSASTNSEPWNGEFYVSFGHGPERSWDDARKYGFISAGGGAWYSKTLQILKPDDRIWVNVPGYGYAGVGKVAGYARAGSEFTVSTPSGEMPFYTLPLSAKYHRDAADDPDRAEYFVPVQWLQTVELSDAVKSIGLFGNQNSAAKPTTPKWRTTIERLKDEFPHHDMSDPPTAPLPSE